MADEHLKYLTGRFTLDTSDLDRAKKATSAGKAELNSIGKDTAGGNSPESRFERIRKAADDVAKVGDKLTVGVTLPVLAIGAAATAATNEFNTTFTRMETLAGVAADEVAGLRDTVKTLSGETGRAPQELAEALYFIRSAGLDGATAVDTLRISAQAAAVGLGSTEQVADALTSVISAYGEANITAAQAADVLVQTAREGKAEAAELAPQFGRLLPVATNLGISFDQVGAGLAFLTRQSGDASLASTQLGGIMNALLKPSAEAKNLLEGVGLSSAGIRKQLREEGLLATLQLLSDRFRGNSEAMGTVFADVQGLQGALALTGASAADAQAVFDSLAGASGELGTAFSKVADDDAFKQQQALAKTKLALIEFGESAAPVATKLAGFASAVTGAFASLPDGLQSATVAVGLLAAAMGPLLSVGGRLVENYDTVKNALTSAAGAFRKTATDAAGAATSTAASSAALGPAGIAIAGVTAAVAVAGVVYDGWRKRKEELKRATDTLRAALDDETKSVTEGARASIEAEIANRNQTDDLARAGVTYDLLTAAVLGSAEAQRELRRRLVESGEVSLQLNESGRQQRLDLEALTDAYVRTGRVGLGVMIDRGEGLVDTFDTLGSALATTAQQTLDQAVAAGKLSTAQADAALGTLKLADGTTDYAAVIDFARAALVEQATATDEVTAAQVEGQPATEQAILGAKELKSLADEVREAEERKAKALRDSYAAVLEGANEQIAYERSQIRTADALGKVDEATGKVAKGGKDLEANQRDLNLALLDARDSLISQAVAAAEADANQRGLKSASDDAAGSLAVQVTELSRMRDSLAPDSPLRAYLDEYIAKLESEIPRQIETELLIRANAFLDTFVGRNADGTVQRRLKTGGPIPGGRDEPVPIVAHGGEFVLSADVVDAIKRGDPTIGLGQRIAGGDVGAPAQAGGQTIVHHHYVANVQALRADIDEAELGRTLDRMVLLHG